MDADVEAAFAAVPRAGFLPPEQQRFAGNDAALSIGYGVTNSQPSTVRAMLELLDVRPGHHVLDVGAGSGWTTALLAHLATATGSVVAVERIPEVLAMGEANLAAARPAAPVETHLARPGVLGWPRAAPYDRILVSAGAEDVPHDLLTQLAPDGIMVIPVGGEMLRVRRDGDPTRHGRYVFVPLVP
ncbi:protein-L-isoaspartate(D-aspartate) O-methyltransferase [Nocardioides thalensis]|uniref:Protein-L-isoaspartate O-methyltransferase n=1 Tax=Nocardioides thalensis TaxID=1914755 RepID=A0A853BX30_9ACTN|nr:protein-L-isoaspartate O-methyltransferase [Nocardioides thalensis]NYI99768.1 protein-L-isoaspartate(D-aspartate) O-methyltransferase [Nocardioides thalensis]